jgi:membrane protease YdiL (CAAX protease family)
MTSQTPPTQQPSEALSPADTTDDYSLADYRPDSTIRWGLPQFFVGLAVFVVIIAAMNLLALALPRGAQGPLLFVAVLVGYGALFGTALLAAKRRGIGSLARDFGLRFRPIDLLIGLGIGLAAKIVGVIVAVPLVGLSGGTPTSNVPLQDDLVWIVLNTVVATTLVAPIVEELFFRGLLLRAVRNGILRGRATHPRTEPPSPSRVRSALLGSVLISSAAFMLVHLYQAPDLATLLVLGSSTLLLGLANAALATRTGRLGPGIVAHIVFNGLALLGLLAIS